MFFLLHQLLELIGLVVNVLLFAHNLLLNVDPALSEFLHLKFIGLQLLNATLVLLELAIRQRLLQILKVAERSG